MKDLPACMAPAAELGRYTATRCKTNEGLQRIRSAEVSSPVAGNMLRRMLSANGIHGVMKIHEFGIAHGVPVVMFFGTPQRGDAGAELHELASDHGIRLLCPTRPWYDDETVVPSFDAVTDPVLQYISAAGINSAYTLGGSGGGPFAFHLTMHGAALIHDCTLLASMGMPDSFARDVSSPPTCEVLKAFGRRDKEYWKAACTRWGLSPDLAHGAWGDFKVFFDDLPRIDRQVTKPVFVYQGAADPNAPLASVQDLLADATDVQWFIEESASHLAMVQDTTGTTMSRIFIAIGDRARGR